MMIIKEGKHSVSDCPNIASIIIDYGLYTTVVICSIMKIDSLIEKHACQNIQKNREDYGP